MIVYAIKNSRTNKFFKINNNTDFSNELYEADLFVNIQEAKNTIKFFSTYYASFANYMEPVKVKIEEVEEV